MEVKLVYIPEHTNHLAVSTHTFKSQWFEDTSTTTVAHNLSDREDVVGYVVQEWNTTTDQRRNIAANSLVVNYDDTNIYLDWTGFTPSSTLKYRIITGGVAIPQSIPSYVGGFTKFVGVGPGSYATLADAIADSEPGDSILVSKSYSISAAEVVNINNIDIQFMPGVEITVTGGSKALDITASRVHVTRPSYKINFAGTLAAAIEISGSECEIERARVEADNAGLTVTAAYNLTGNLNYLAGMAVATQGTITGTIANTGTDNDTSVRG